MTDLSNIWRFDLTKGSSKDPRTGACLMDAVSWFEYGRLGDHPPCVAETLVAPGRIINDLLPDDRRQELKGLIPLMIGTAGDGFDQARGEYWAWQAIRVFAPLALEFAGLEVHATILRQFSGNLAEAAGAAETAAGAAGYAAWAAWTAAQTAARAARAAAQAAGQAAEAARVAAWSAARAAEARAAGQAAADIRPTTRAKIDDAIIAAMRGACEIGRPRELTAQQIEHANHTFELARA
jgi:hypothetical protein